MKKKQIIFYAVTTLIFFGLLYKLEYATDTYSVFNFNKEQIYIQFASSGRFITAILGRFIKIMKISEQIMYITSWTMGIFCATLSQYKLYTIVEKNVENKALKLLIPILIIVNPFSIELFLYIEKGIMWFAVLFSIYAVDNLIKFFKAKKIKNIIWASILMFVANSSYQGVVRNFYSNFVSICNKTF